jgi:pimeloyl-ACP methyl ester carboxylesterase
LLLDDLIAKYASDRKVVLVGHSAGGALAGEYARTRASSNLSLVLLDAAILTSGGGSGPFEWFFHLPQMQRLGPILVAEIASSGNALLEESYYDKSQLT